MVEGIEVMAGMEKWQGRIAVVTGASVGIGAALCKSLTEAGMIVCGMSKRKDKMEEVRKTLNCPKEQLNCIECDIRNEQSVQVAFKWIDEKYGGIDLLINNAGVITKGLLLDAKNTVELYRTMETNIIGLCLVTREAVRLMKKKDDEFGTIGHIVNINSIFGHKIHACVPGTKPLNGMYPASKFAVTAITECVRQELLYLGTKIKCTSISPGLVEGDIGTLNTSHDMIKLMPKLNPTDVADAVLFAISTPENVLIHELIIKPVGEFL